MAGSAVLTTVLSMKTISVPMDMTARTSQRRHELLMSSGLATLGVVAFTVRFPLSFVWFLT